MTIFSWGGDIQLYNLLQNIKFFVLDTFYIQAIMYLGAFLSAFFATVKFGADPIKTGIKHIFIATIYIQLFLVPSNQKVVIEDVVKNSALQVSDLPYGYVIILSTLSQLEYYSTEAIENAFTTPNSLKINETGLGFGMSVHLRMSEAMTIDDDLLESFGLYYYNCLRPELYMKRKTHEQISMSDDILLSLEPTVAFETLVYENGESTQLSCEEALAWLRPKVDLEAYKYLLNSLSSQLGMSASKVDMGIEDMNSVLYGVSKNAKDSLTQAMMRNLLNHGEIESARIIGADVATATYAAVQAREQTRNTWNVAGKQAVENLPLMRITYYNLVIGLFIFLSLFSAITGLYKYVGLGIGILLSLSLWNPLGALLNSFYYAEMEEHISTLAYLGDFMTLAKMDIVNEKIARQLAMMSNIYTYIPLIAMALVTGSFFGINAMATTTGANTSGIGGELTKGNIDVGHTRIGNATIGAIDVANSEGHFSNKENGVTTLSSQKQTENGLTYTQRDLNDSNNTVEGKSSVGTVTASNNGLNDVQSAYVTSKMENSISNSSEKVNSTSKTASSEIANVLSEQLNNTHGVDTVEKISELTGVSKETAQQIEQSRVNAMEKALASSLTEEEREELVKDTMANLSAGFKILGSGASAGVSVVDVDGNSKTVSLSQQSAEKLQSSYKENLAESLKENKSVLNDISTSVSNGTTQLSSEAVNATNAYSKAVKEDESYKQAISTAQSLGLDLTTQVVEQAVKLQNPNFNNLSSNEKVQLTQEYLYDVSQGGQDALNSFKTAENIVVSKYSAEQSINEIDSPRNTVKTEIENQSDFTLDKTSLNNFKDENPLPNNEKPFNETAQKIENGKNAIEDSNRADILKSMDEWINEHSRPNGLNADSINNTKNAIYGEDKKEIKELKNEVEDLGDVIEKMNISKNTIKADEKL